ncbi:AbiTii domain-containing protein [Alishewanella longhuensis]
MTGLVLELQRDSLDRNVRVSDLLRKAFVISRKLNISEIQEWINYELNGYPRDEDIIPDYRQIHGTPKIWNPYHGWQPLNFGDPKMADQLSSRKNSQAIGELDELAAKGSSGGLYMPYPQHIVNWLMERMDVPLQPSLLVPHTEVIGILDAVRNRVLDWALQLETQGVLGEGMSFTEKEKQSAHTVTYQVTNNIGSMQNSQLQQDSPNATQSLTVNMDLNQLAGFIKKLKGQLEGLQLNSTEKAELCAEIATIENQIASPKPKPVIVRESLKTVRSLLEGIAGSMIASGLLTQLAAFL